MKSDDNFENELIELEKKGLKRSLSDRNQLNTLNLSSNDYLGLSEDPFVKERAAKAVQDYGTGGTSSRLLAGTSSLHRELEVKLATFFSKEAALVFSSGYHVNTGVLPVLAGAGDIIFVDRLCHASILDGIKLSDARFATFDHNNLEDLSWLLTERRAKYRRAWVVTEGIFSMDGDCPPLQKLIELAHQHDALVYLDEAHSIGIYGPEGKGWAASQKLLDSVDVFVGTLSKSLASQGGFVVSSRPLIEILISRCRSFIYTTALAPASAGAALGALERLPALDDRRKLLMDWSSDLRSELKTLGFSTGPSQSQIVPVLTGDVISTQKLSAHLLSHGFFVPSIRPPTVPVGEGRVRLSLTVKVAEKAKCGLIQAFASFAERPQGKPEKIGQKS